MAYENKLASFLQKREDDICPLFLSYFQFGNFLFFLQWMQFVISVFEESTALTMIIKIQQNHGDPRPTFIDCRVSFAILPNNDENLPCPCLWILLADFSSKPLAKKNNEIDIHFVDAAMVLIVLNAIFQLLDFLNLKVTWL